MRRTALVPFALLAACSALRASRLTAQAPAAADARPRATAVRADRAPVVDGREDDPVWRQAPATGGFREFSPAQDKDARFRTEFKAAYDDRNLYVFVRAFDPHPDSLMTALTRRDVRGPSDQIKLLVDAYHDRRSGFEFAVNPVGVKRDYLMFNDGQEDASWDGVWDVGTRVDSAGWTAEFRIPFSQLRYGNRPEHVFGFGIWRDIERYKERASWPVYRPTQPGMSSQLGELVGIRDIVPFRRRELLPYAVTRNSTVRRAVAAPGAATAVPDWGRAQKNSLGADLKYGFTPNLTVDATINPDFGQVEADPSVVNLTAFKQFFQERRPFFIEGIGLYTFTQNSTQVNRSAEGLFYSRRIGRSPQLFGRYADDASTNVTPILGAGKLTGRLGRGLNVGVLEAVTGRVDGTARRTTEPQTSYTVARLQQDLRDGETSVGIIGTGTVRALDEWTRDFLRRDAYAAGADVRHRWGRNRYEFAARATASAVRGTRQSILRTQLSPVHLFQRPDDARPVDSARTSLAGDAQEVSFAKFGGNMVRYLVSYDRQSQGYEINDLGFLRRSNRQTQKNWLGLQFQKPTRVYRQVQANFNFQQYWTAGGLRLDRAVNTNGAVNLANNQWVYWGSTVGRLPGSFCDNCARGGPAVRQSPVFNWNLGWQGDDRRRIVPSLFVADGYGERADDRFRSRNLHVTPGVELRLRPELQLGLVLDWSRNVDDVQWLGNFADSAGTTHHAFARLEQTTRTLTVRGSYTITPTLGVQLWAQPFVSRGRYGSVRELSATPRAAGYGDRYQPYAPPAGTDLGFDVLQLRSNSVLRWEFRPGSTLFAVWQHGREGFDPRFRSRGWRSEYGDLFALHPANTFLVKLAYWLN